MYNEERMYNVNELDDLEQIKAALSQLDLKGTDDTVTQAMTVVSLAAELVVKGRAVKAEVLLNEMKKRTFFQQPESQDVSRRCPRTTR